MSGARLLELRAALRDHNRVLLDTCVLIEEYRHQRQQQQARLFKEIRATQRAMPLVALWEFLHREAGQLLPHEELREGPGGAVDCLIAAEGLARGCPVLTYNVKHFQVVQGLLLVGLQQP